MPSVCAGLEDVRRLVDAMPSADARVSFLTMAHRNPQTRWERNDIFDIDAVSVAVPYCDIVATDNHAHHILHASRVPDRLGATVLRDLPSLVADLHERL